MKILKITAITISAAAAILLITLLFFVITEYRPSDIEEIAPYKTISGRSTPGGLRLFSWNLGYCGLDADMDFFMEGGENTKRSPLENQRTALDAVVEELKKQESDVCFIQEIDRSSRRSFNIDQLYTVSESLSGYESYFSTNFKSPFVPLPVQNPIGKVESGIATFSRFTSSTTQRLQLPGSFGWPVKIFHLKRCIQITRIPSPVEDRDWCLLNIHLTAYDEGDMRKQQLDYLKILITDLYEQGHYVVIGGDWNSLFPGVSEDQFGSYTTPEEHLFWLSSVPEDWTPENWQWCYDDEVPTARTLEQPYKAGENGTFIIDGFLVSPNLRVDEVRGYNLRFEHSDHNPVAITVSIR